MLSFLREQFPPEAKVRGSNPLGRAIYVNLINILKIPVVQVLGKIVGENGNGSKQFCVGDVFYR